MSMWQFLQSCIAKDRQAAIAAMEHGAEPWFAAYAGRRGRGYGTELTISDAPYGEDSDDYIWTESNLTRHIQRWDPSHVIAALDALDSVVRMHTPVEFRGKDGSTDEWCDVCGHQPRDPKHSYPCATLKALALLYADNPDYRDEWRP